MLSVPSGHRCRLLAVAALLALGAPTAVSAQPPQTAPTRGGATGARAGAGTETARPMAPMRFAVFFCRVSGSGHGASPWWMLERRWRRT